MIHPCGCINATDTASGVLKSITKCDRHRAAMIAPGALDETYYTRLGVISDGALRATRHVAELVEAMGPLPAAPAGGVALEVGCGVSPYVGALRAAGWEYRGLEPSPWAARWMHRFLRAEVWCGCLETFPTGSLFDLILSAHALEHIPDAPGAIRRCADLLAPGGALWVLVPDDSDPVNPDHLWFFTPATLRRCVEMAGLAVEEMAVRRIVPHENFIYLRARKGV